MIDVQTQRRAQLIFDLEDLYARDRGVRGPRPRPLSEVELWLVGEMVGSTLEPFDEPWRMITRRNPSGYHLFYGEVELAGGKRRSQVAEGTYAVQVEGDFYQQASRQDIALPEALTPYAFDLAPGFRYPFPRESSLSKGRGTTLLRGGVHHRDGSGIAGVTIEVTQASYSYSTDDTGQWVLVFPDDVTDSDLTVRFVWPDRPPTEVDGVPLIQGRDNSLMQTALRGWVTTDTGVPIRGATVEVVGQSGLVETRGDGAWFYYFDPTQPEQSFDIEFVLPDGRNQIASSILVRPRATVVVPTIRFS